MGKMIGDITPIVGPALPTPPEGADKPSLGEPPKSSMTFDRQAPTAVNKMMTVNQPIANMANLQFEGGKPPTMETYNPAYTDYMNQLNDFNFAKQQFDRDYSLDNARLAAEHSRKLADARASRLSGGIGGLFGRMFQVAPVQTVVGTTPEEQAYQDLMAQYQNNPLSPPSPYTPPQQGYTPLATTPIGGYSFR